MEITEKDLEDLIFEDLARGGEDLQDRGFDVSLLDYERFQNAVHWHRQVQLKAYGIADIIGFTRQTGVIHVNLIELKNKPIKSEDFDQLFRYRKAVSDIIKNSFKGRVSKEIHCILVGPSMETGHYIHNVAFNCSVIEFKFSIRGFQFEAHVDPGWYKIDSREINLNSVTCSQQVTFPRRLTPNTSMNGQKVY